MMIYVNMKPDRYMARAVRALALATCLLAVMAAHAANNDLPVLGDASSSIISPALEKQIGRDFLKQIHSGSCCVATS